MTEQNPKIKELREKAMNLPLEPGVYLMKNKQGAIIYVGKAKNLKNRVSQYFGSDRNHQYKVIQMVLHVCDFDYIITDNEFEALVLENSLIKQHQPKYNILLKDDKGYSYIRISQGDWPSINEAKQTAKDNAKYIGPFMSSWSVKSCIDEAKKIFLIPTCSKKFPEDIRSSRPCLNFYIKQCSAPCAGKISQKNYLQNVNEAVDFIKNGSSESIKILTEKMEEAAENLNFERAASLRDRINAIKRIGEKQKVVESNINSQDVIATAMAGEKIVVTVLKFRENRLRDRLNYVFDKEDSEQSVMIEFLERYYQSHDIPPIISLEKEPDEKEFLCDWLSKKAERKVEIYIPQRGQRLKLLEMCKNNAAEKLSEGTKRTGKEISAVEELAKLLGMKTLPEYIESYDISNLSGGENVAGMVVFKDGRPHKSAYKRFKIKEIIGQDDYGSMREVLMRRLNEYRNSQEETGFGKMPDLILLDGGKGHVSTVQELVKNMGYNIPIFGMVKDNKHKTRAIAVDGGEIAINSNRKAFTLVSSIQEEVHRFAISYHRTLRKKSTINSQLLKIDGIGENRAKILLKEFKTIKNISQKTIEELESLKGMNKKSAEAVYNYFSEK